MFGRSKTAQEIIEEHKKIIPADIPVQPKNKSNKDENGFTMDITLEDGLGIDVSGSKNELLLLKDSIIQKGGGFIEVKGNTYSGLGRSRDNGNDIVISRINIAQIKMITITRDTEDTEEEPEDEAED
jgi:hypothetical protein